MNGTTMIRKWGNSQAVRLPKNILDAVSFTEKDELVIEVVDNAIVMRKAQTKKTIEELFEGYHGNYIAEEVDFGKPQGKEIW